MANKVSVVINTYNEEKNILKAIESVKWADEVIVCDMFSEDKTVDIAKKAGAKIFFHKKEGFVEPARNFVISKASNEWILVLDADEVISETLSERLFEVASKMNEIDYVKIPRKNLIFGHFMKASMWWPDYQVRFFKKGKVKWTDSIHRPPEVFGEGLDFPMEENYAIIHRNYETISQFLERMNRYSGIEAEELKKKGYVFNWKDLLEKPFGEFLSRYFAGKGYEDGLHGLVLSLLQAVSFFVVYLKLWEMNKFDVQNIKLEDIRDQKDKSSWVIDYWLKQAGKQKNFFERLFK